MLPPAAGFPGPAAAVMPPAAGSPGPAAAGAPVATAGQKLLTAPAGSVVIARGASVCKRYSTCNTTVTEQGQCLQPKCRAIKVQRASAMFWTPGMPRVPRSMLNMTLPASKAHQSANKLPAAAACPVLPLLLGTHNSDHSVADPMLLSGLPGCIGVPHPLRSASSQAASEAQKPSG